MLHFHHLLDSIVCRVRLLFPAPIALTYRRGVVGAFTHPTTQWGARCCRRSFLRLSLRIFSDLIYFLPGCIRCVLGHRLSADGGPRAQVFLINNTVPVDDKGHHSRRSVFRGIGHESESARHIALDHILLRTAGHVPSLACKDAIIVAVKRPRLSSFLRMIFTTRQCEQRAHWTLRLAAGDLPVETVVFAVIAPESGRVPFY